MKIYQVMTSGVSDNRGIRRGRGWWNAAPTPLKSANLET